MLLRKLTLIAGIACSVLLNASFLSGQESKPPQTNSTTARAQVLRRVEVKHVGFDNVILNDTTVQQEMNSWNQFKDRLRVEHPYDQEKADEMKKILQSFWKEQGITVEVRTTLTPLPNSPRYAVLIFTVYKQESLTQRRGSQRSLWAHSAF
jgi:maltose-binding protein MalE